MNGQQQINTAVSMIPAVGKVIGVIADEVWTELRTDREQGLETPSFNQHPVMRLFTEQIQFLASGDYSTAAQICKERAKE